MDRWKRKELKQMELGGNKNAKIYYTERNMYVDGKPDHTAAPHAAHKQELSAKAEAVLKSELAMTEINASAAAPASQPLQAN